MDLLLSEGEGEVEGFRHKAGETSSRHDRWVVNKLRALMSWYSKGLPNGGNLRTKINAAASVPEARDIIEQFFAVNHPSEQQIEASLSGR
jgi:hypothetical protein